MLAADKQRIRVLFLIRQLEIGGAERQLLTLVKGLPKDRWDITVATMYRSRGLAEDFARTPGVRVISLDKGGRYDVAGFGYRLYRAMKETRPMVVHGYMTGANEIALLLGVLFRIPVIWGIRVSAMDFNRYNRWTYGVFRAGIMLSRWVDLLIANSEAGLRHHEGLGMHARRNLVISNGVDTDHFQRNEQSGLEWRKAQGLGEKDLVVGMVARFDPMKDHETFFQVVAQLVREGITARFVCVGEGSTDDTLRVHAASQTAGVSDFVTFVKPTPNPVAMYSGLSVLVSTSAFGEGFPNVLGEAMACEVPCISTDTGDAARVVGAPERVVRAGDAAGIASALRDICALSDAERRVIGASGRARICGEFSVQRLVDRSVTAFESVIPPRRG